jgi:hypothetical protein
MGLNWKVGISNGENFTEGVYPFEFIPNKKSPWLRLIDYLNLSDSKITSLCLVYKDRTFNLPSAGNNPKFRNFDVAEKPIKYDFGRVIGVDKNGDDKYARIEAIYSNYKLQLWVDEKNPNNCWVLVIDSHG